MPVKRLMRGLFRAWGRIGRAPGYRYQLLDRYGAQLAENELLSARLPNGCVVRCDLRDHVQRQIWFNGAYEPVEAFLFTRLLQPGMTVIDAGANVGQYSLLAATAVGPRGSVHAFEPVPPTFARLKEHVEANQLGQRIQLNQAALWSEDTVVQLGLAEDQVNNIGSYSAGVADRSEAPVAAKAIRLDQYAASVGLERIDMIKMDIEGAEPAAFAGAGEIIERDRPLILMEVNRIALERLGSSPELLFQMIEPWGYQAWRIGATPELSGPIKNFDRLEQDNVLLHFRPLPDNVIGGWTYRQAMQWARSAL